MYCPKCGNEVQKSMKFCEKCGAALNNAAPEVNKSAYNSPNETNMQKTPKADAGIMAQKIIAGAGKAADQIGAKSQKWGAKYLDTWKQCQKLDNKKKYLWFGIHGGVVLLLLCMIIAPVFSGGSEGSGGLGGSGGSRGGRNVEKLFNKAAEDGEFSEKDIKDLAQAISDYEDLQKLYQCYDNGYKSDTDNMLKFPGFLNLYHNVSTECRKLSDLGEVTGRFMRWYDRDGLTEKIFKKSGPVDYVYFSNYGDMSPIVNDESVHQDADGHSVNVEWFTYADSDEITFIKTIYGGTSSEKKTEQYDGRIEVSGTEILVTLDGKQYHLSEADTDLNARQAESFEVMASGNWKYTVEFYNMIARNLGSWEKFTSDGSTPSYITFSSPTGQFVLVGSSGAYLERIKGFKYEQGEGKTVTFSSDKGSMKASYDKVGNNLIITVNGTDYKLEPASTSNTGIYNDFGGRK